MSERKLTQNELVLRHLKDYGKINPMEALKEYGIMRLGARIYDLKKQGYKIASKTGKGRNRYGEKVTWAEYTLANQGR